MLGIVSIELKEINTGRVVSRDIDISNIMNWSTMIPHQSVEGQRDSLESWIKERGVDQHESELELISWVVQ